MPITVPRWLKWLSTGTGAVLTVIGLVSVPDELRQWASVIDTGADAVNGDTARWILVALGLFIIAFAQLAMKSRQGSSKEGRSTSELSSSQESPHADRLRRELDDIDTALAERGMPSLAEMAEEREGPLRSDRRNPMLGARIASAGNHPVPSEALHLIDSFVLQVDMQAVRTPHTEAEFREWRDDAGGLTHQADRIAGYLIELDPDWASYVHTYRSEPIADVGPTFSSEHEGWKRELLQLRTRLKRVRALMDQ